MPYLVHQYVIHYQTSVSLSLSHLADTAPDVELKIILLWLPNSGNAAAKLERAKLFAAKAEAA